MRFVFDACIVDHLPSPQLFTSTTAVYKRIRYQLLVICELVTPALLCCVQVNKLSKTRIMQSSTIIVLLCIVAAVVASVHHEYPAEDALHFPEDSLTQYDTPAHERSPRTKRGLLLLKKKLLLGALGLKAAKIGAVGAGVAGAIALKKKAHTPPLVEVHSFSG